MVITKFQKVGALVSVLALASLTIPAAAQQNGANTASSDAAIPDMSALATAAPADVTTIVAAAVTANPGGAAATVGAAVVAAPGAALLIVSAAAGVPGVNVSDIVVSALMSMTPAARAASAAVLLAAAAAASGQSVALLAASVAAAVTGIGSATELAAAASSVDLTAALAAAGATGSTEDPAGGDEGEQALAAQPEPAAANDGSPTALTAS